MDEVLRSRIDDGRAKRFGRGALQKIRGVAVTGAAAGHPLVPAPGDRHVIPAPAKARRGTARALRSLAVSTPSRPFGAEALGVLGALVTPDTEKTHGCAHRRDLNPEYGPEFAEEYLESFGAGYPAHLRLGYPALKAR